MLARLQRRRLLLRANRELGGEEAMFLRHRGLGAIEHVVDELTSVRRLDALAVDVVRALLIDDEEMVATRPAGDVGVLSQLDVAVGAEDGHPSVAPGRESVWGEPVHADVA